MRGHLAALSLCLLLLLPGCRDHRHTEPQVPPTQGDRVGTVLDCIAGTGVGADYVTLGRTLHRQGRIVILPARAMAGMLGYADFATGRIELSEALFAYPPDRQGYVLLHELVHLRSGEQSHAGPWWGTLDEYDAHTCARGAQEE